MMSKIYKCVPVSQNVIVGKKGSSKDTSNAIEDLINSNANQGWELDNIIETSTIIPAGCIAGLLGSKGTAVDSNILVFSKEN